MRKFYTISILWLYFMIQAQDVKAQSRAVKPEKPNILFIVVDDLRTELGCYGKSNIYSPNIDRLAKSGIVFTNAYCNYAQCMSSRASLLSGLYPSNTRYTAGASQDKDTPGIVSLPMYFKNNNYKTVSLGKVYHFFDDGKGSWDKNWRPPVTTTAYGDYQSPESIDIFEKKCKQWQEDLGIRIEDKYPLKFGPYYEKPDVPDILYMDGKIAYKAVEELQNFKNNSEPFFLAVGFHKPHLPFNAPLKYWNMYDRDDFKIPYNYFFPKNAPEAAMSNWEELRRFNGIPQEGPVPDSIAYNLIHGYYACVSYVDAQVGLVLDAVERLGLSNNTIIILLGDHGWFLGEHGFWAKISNFERAVHAPLILKVPWKSLGLKTDALVEFVDIYPTLCDLAGFDLPIHLQGKSFAPLLDNLVLPWKEMVFYRTGGETILTKNYSYTEWINKKTGEPDARMLYDRKADPDENINIAELLENNKLIKELHEKLHAHLKEINYPAAKQRGIAKE